MSQVERTFSIVKPDAVAEGHAGEILGMLEKEGFRILGMRMVRLSQQQAEGFYAVHRARPFFPSLVKFMTEGPIIALALEREDAVKKLREVMGATNPANAADGTVRTTDGHSGAWKVFDPEAMIYTVVVGRDRWSLKLMPGRGLANTSDVSTLVFQAVR